MALIEFDMAKAKKYRPRYRERFFVEVNVGSSVESRIGTTFGEQVFQGPMFINVTDHDNIYGIAAAEFYLTHDRVGPRQAGRVIKAQKTVEVHAYQMTVAGKVETETSRGQIELTRAALPGMWLIHQTDEDIYLLEDDEFQERYEPVEENASAL